jgi:hypothetical protein
MKNKVTFTYSDISRVVRKILKEEENEQIEISPEEYMDLLKRVNYQAQAIPRLPKFKGKTIVVTGSINLDNIKKITDLGPIIIKGNLNASRSGLSTLDQTQVSGSKWVWDTPVEAKRLAIILRQNLTSQDELRKAGEWDLTNPNIPEEGEKAQALFRYIENLGSIDTLTDDDQASIEELKSQIKALEEEQENLDLYDEDYIENFDEITDKQAELEDEIDSILYDKIDVYDLFEDGGHYKLTRFKSLSTNQEFAVGETNNAKFTVMGRYISLGTEKWSVVAFLTYAKDEKGRQVPTYRFFFSEGNAILDILCRIITFEAEKQTLPVFNPFAITNLYQYRPTALSEINNKIPKDNSLEEEVKKEANIRTHILKENACTLVGGRFVGLSLFHLNRLALQRASAINEAGNISWAYNADVLQRPETFILVQATNERSYQYLMSKRNSRKKYQAGVDEKAIETALQSLVESDNIDDIAPVSLNVIAEALQDSKVDEAYVRGIAEILGLNDYELNNQTYDQLIKLHIILSLFFPNVKEQTQRWQLLGNKGWNEVITAYISKIKKYVKKAGLPSLLQDTNRELIEYCFQNISFETRNVEPNKSEHIAWVLTKSLWANDNTLLDLENTIRDYVGYAFEKSKQEIVTSNSPTQDYFQLVKYFRFLRNIGRVELEKFEFVWQF